MSNAIPFMMFLLLAVIAFCLSIREVRRYYLLRERFLRLSENATLAYCKQLTEELRKENVW
jgi:hypothetical protein